MVVQDSSLRSINENTPRNHSSQEHLRRACGCQLQSVAPPWVAKEPWTVTDPLEEAEIFFEKVMLTIIPTSKG